MLHIAPEHCFISKFEALSNLEYITGDIESPLAKVKMDIHEIPFDESSFDVIFCNHVLEHVDDDIKAMSEINRVLKPGGWAILQIPLFYPLSDVTTEDLSITDPRKREELFGQDDHVRKYGKDFPLRIQKAGLHVKEEKLIFELDEEEKERYALPKEEIIYRAVKV